MGNENSNKPCQCGSLKKYKKCCGHYSKANSRSIPPEVEAAFRKMHEEHHIKEQIRIQQQGKGKPIITEMFQGNRLIAVRNRVYHSGSFRTFPDFLNTYMLDIFGRDWFSTAAKDGELEHPIKIWKSIVTKQWQAGNDVEGFPQLTSINSTGALKCLVGLAYSLFLIDQNSELQDHLIKRLKDPNNFQGAYYESIVINCLVRAGLEIELEDEQNNNIKHCELYAVSKETNQRYSIEAKARGLKGVLGKIDGPSAGGDPTIQLTKHINAALKKPSENAQRIIFVDLNHEDSNPSWAERAGEKLEQKEDDLLDGVQAYILVTNMNFHYHLENTLNSSSGFAHGLGIYDFARKGPITLREYYHQRKKHSDIHRVLENIMNYPNIPQTFDGSMVSDTFESSNSIKIGKEYFFDSIGKKARVTTATVSEEEKLMYIGTDQGHVLTKAMSETQLEDFRNHKDYFFGTYLEHNKPAKDIFDFFESMVKIHMKWPLEALHSQINMFPDKESLMKLEHEDLVITYAERLAHQTYNIRK